MNFEIIDEITEIETIARGSGIRDLDRLHRIYGQGNWRKMKDVAHIRLSNGRIITKSLLIDLKRREYSITKNTKAILVFFQIKKNQLSANLFNE